MNVMRQAIKVHTFKILMKYILTGPPDVCDIAIKSAPKVPLAENIPIPIPFGWEGMGTKVEGLLYAWFVRKFPMLRIDISDGMNLIQLVWNI